MEEDTVLTCHYYIIFCGQKLILFPCHQNVFPPGLLACFRSDKVLLDLGVVGGSASWCLFEPLILLVAAVVLLDEDGGPPALLETLLLVVRPELGLDQDGCLGHLLIESILRGQTEC